MNVKVANPDEDEEDIKLTKIDTKSASNEITDALNYFSSFTKENEIFGNCECKAIETVAEDSEAEERSFK